MSFVGGLHNFDINKASFINAPSATNVEITHVYQQQLVNAASILDGERAVEATHKSSTAEYAPKCNPKTRKKVIGDILEWVGAPPAPKSILWFDGPVGAGKTCIMREVVVRCEATPGMVVASYFFSTRVNGLIHARPFIATIAHQLAHSGIPGLKTAILQAISDNPSIFRDGLESQMQALIAKPLQGCGFSNLSFAPSRRAVIVVDGLDECREEREREHLLKLLLVLVNKLSPSLTVIIASRPELDIRTTFALEDFKAATHVVRLHSYDGRNDVRIFYCDEFEKIRQTHPLRQYIPVSWPTEEILHALVTKSSGQFVYPAVIMKYIASRPRQNPVKLLENVMAISLSSDTDNPLAELDALYTLILHPPDVDFPLMRLLLHTIIHMAADVPHFKTPLSLDNFLQLPHGTTDATLCDLHSILHIPDYRTSTGPIRFHHKSLEDFLLSPSRSKDLFRSPYDTGADLTLVHIRHAQSWASNPRVNYSAPEITYAVRSCIPYIQKMFANRSNQTFPAAILDFDPRCLPQYFFVHFSRPQPTFGTLNLHSVLHETHCAGRSECPPLCKGLLLMDQCQAKMDKFIADHPRHETRSSRLALLPRFKTETGLYPECQSEQVSADGKSTVLMPVSAWLGEVGDPTFVPLSLPGPSAIHHVKSIWSLPEAVESSKKKRKFDSPNGPFEAWDPPKGRFTAKSLFACDYKDRNPDASEKGFERAWRNASKGTKADFGARADAAKADRNASKRNTRKK